MEMTKSQRICLKEEEKAWSAMNAKDDDIAVVCITEKSTDRGLCHRTVPPSPSSCCYIVCFGSRHAHPKGVSPTFLTRRRPMRLCRALTPGRTARYVPIDVLTGRSCESSRYVLERSNDLTQPARVESNALCSLLNYRLRENASAGLNAKSSPCLDNAGIDGGSNAAFRGASLGYPIMNLLVKTDHFWGPQNHTT